ncbi:VOC family protein [Streptosporangiaceae bacterium NEAU-GS5]|nr:VOC family protein [Streptosporangiaceae bacterium NEAU-GS5]
MSEPSQVEAMADQEQAVLGHGAAVAGDARSGIGQGAGGLAGDVAGVAEAIDGCRPNLLVSDLSASLRFYAEGLGFRIGWRWSDRYSEFVPDGGYGEPGEPGTALVGRGKAQLLLTQKAGAHSDWVHLDVHMASQVDRLFEEWRARGVRISEAPVRRPWGMYEMRLFDPDGHVLRVSSPPHAEPEPLEPEL